MTKRIFDILFSFLSILLCFPFLFVFWVLAVLDTKTNGIFMQERIGQCGKKFNIYKLRTIQVSLPSEKKVVSRIGKLFRRYKLDELPQFINVLKGEMSIVGPRPDLPGYYDLLEGDNRQILELKPGLTSLASLKYRNEEKTLDSKKYPLNYNDTIIFPDKIKMNLEYYKTQSFWGDILIIFKTIKQLLYLG